MNFRRGDGFVALLFTYLALQLMQTLTPMAAMFAAVMFEVAIERE